MNEEKPAADQPRPELLVMNYLTRLLGLSEQPAPQTEDQWKMRRLFVCESLMIVCCSLPAVISAVANANDLRPDQAAVHIIAMFCNALGTDPTKQIKWLAEQFSNQGGPYSKELAAALGWTDPKLD